jgi:hypothetical protein
MNVPLNYNNMFKWGVPLNIKKDSQFWYPNHALTQKPIGRSKLGKGPSGTLVKLDCEAHHNHMGKKMVKRWKTMRTRSIMWMSFVMDRNKQERKRFIELHNVQKWARVKRGPLNILPWCVPIKELIMVMLQGSFER